VLILQVCWRSHLITTVYVCLTNMVADYNCQQALVQSAFATTVESRNGGACNRRADYTIPSLCGGDDLSSPTSFFPNLRTSRPKDVYRRKAHDFWCHRNCKQSNGMKGDLHPVCTSHCRHFKEQVAAESHHDHTQPQSVLRLSRLEVFPGHTLKHDQLVYGHWGTSPVWCFHLHSHSATLYPLAKPRSLQD
jgi:hypothetical protein